MSPALPFKFFYILSKTCLNFDISTNAVYPLDPDTKVFNKSKASPQAPIAFL